MVPRSAQHLAVPVQLLDMKIFVDTDSDIRLVRRLRRDISERGRDIEGVIKQYNKFVKPAFDQYIQPTMRVADIVVPWGSGNTVAIDLIVQHMHSQLEEVSQLGQALGPLQPPGPSPCSPTPLLLLAPPSALPRPCVSIVLCPVPASGAPGLLAQPQPSVWARDRVGCLLGLLA